MKTLEDLRHYMEENGRVVLLPSHEDAPRSVWVTDDVAPGGIAGYYERAIAPLPHRWAVDGKIAQLTFELENTTFRIRASAKTTVHANKLYVVQIFFTVLEWIDAGIVDRSVAFAPFALQRDDPHEWWRVLRTPPDASRAEIERAYRHQVGQVHPDHGGTHEAFLRVRAAYEEGLALVDRAQ